MSTFTIRPSRQLTGLITLLYLATGITLLFLPLPNALKGLASILHSIHGFTLWHYSLNPHAQDTIVSLQYIRPRSWRLYNRYGDKYDGMLARGSVCTRYFAVLRFTLIPTQQRRSVVIFPDSLSACEFRQLRQLLWWHL